MKKTIYMLMSAAVMLLASCSQNEDLIQTGSNVNGEVSVTFNVKIPEMQTRAVDADADETTVSRYICQIWEGSVVTAGQEPERTIEQANPDFTMLLKKDTQYTLLLWADRGNVKTGVQTDAELGNYYDTGNLTQVKVIPSTTEDGSAGLAFYASQQVNVTSTADITGRVELKHAVAKVCLYETNVIAPSSTLSVKYAPARIFNVADGTIADNTEEKTLTFALDANGVDATAETGGTRIARFYVLAPDKEKSEGLSELTFTLTEPRDQARLRDSKETVKTVSNVPLQANYVTNIRGEFSDYTNKTFNVALDNAWEAETTTGFITINMADFTTKDEYLEFFNNHGKSGTLIITGDVAAADITLIGQALYDKQYSYILDFSRANIKDQLPGGSFAGFGLKGLILPEGLRNINNYSVFNSAWGLEFVKLPTSLRGISESIFYGCDNLVSVNLDETSVTDIPFKAFEGCKSIEKLALGNVSYISNFAFANTGLKVLDLSKCEDVPAIMNTSLSGVDIPNLKVYVKSADMIDTFVSKWNNAKKGSGSPDFTAANFIVKQ